MVLGLYFLTISFDGEAGEGSSYANVGEIEHATNSKKLSLHAKIKARLWKFNENGEHVPAIFETTPGRVILSEILPKNANLPFDIVNKQMTNTEISKLIDSVYRHC